MDMGKALKHLCISPDVDRRLYGFPPKMASTSQGPYWRPASQQFPRARQLGRQPGPHQGQHASGPGRDQQGRRAPHELRVHEVHAPGPRSSTSTWPCPGPLTSRRGVPRAPVMVPGRGLRRRRSSPVSEPFRPGCRAPRDQRKEQGVQASTNGKRALCVLGLIPARSRASLTRRRKVEFVFASNGSH